MEAIIGSIFSDERLQLIVALALICAIADTVIAMTMAVVRRTFSLEVAANFLGDHVLARIVPVSIAAFFATAFEVVITGQEGIPAAITVIVTGAWAVAWGGLAVYAGETFKSIQSSVQPADPV